MLLKCENKLDQSIRTLNYERINSPVEGNHPMSERLLMRLRFLLDCCRTNWKRISVEADFYSARDRLITSLHFVPDCRYKPLRTLMTQRVPLVTDLYFPYDFCG